MTMQCYRKVADANLHAAAAAPDGFLESELHESSTDGHSLADSRKAGCAELSTPRQVT